MILVFFVEKKGRKKRIVQDYKIFTKLDLCQSYNNI